jgi:hypothetical protein
MPLAGFEPTIPVIEQAEAIHALDRAATVTGRLILGLLNYAFSTAWVMGEHRLAGTEWVPL